MKSVVQMNPYFGCIMLVEPLYEYEHVVSSSSSSSSSSLMENQVEKKHDENGGGGGASSSSSSSSATTTGTTGKGTGDGSDHDRHNNSSDDDDDDDSGSESDSDNDNDDNHDGDDGEKSKKRKLQQKGKKGKKTTKKTEKKKKKKATVATTRSTRSSKQQPSSTGTTNASSSGSGSSSSGSGGGTTGSSSGSGGSSGDGGSSSSATVTSTSGKKYKKMSVSDLYSTGYYVMATDLYGVKKKSVIGRILDDHRKFVKRCLLVNHIKCVNELSYIDICQRECETKIPNFQSITESFPSNLKIKSSESETLRKIVDIYQSHGGKAPQKASKKIDVNQVLNQSDENRRITMMCPESTGCVNDLNVLIRYVTSCMTFPFSAKMTCRYSFLNEKQIEFTLNITTVNYRCKQGVIFKGTVTSAQIQPLDYKFIAKGGDALDHASGGGDDALDDDDLDDGAQLGEDGRPRKRRRITTSSNVGGLFQNTDMFNGREVKVDASRITLCGQVSAENYKILTDYQVWFCHSVLVDEKKVDEQWNNLRYYLQFIQ